VVAWESDDAIYYTVSCEKLFGIGMTYEIVDAYKTSIDALDCLDQGQAQDVNYWLWKAPS